MNNLNNEISLKIIVDEEESARKLFFLDNEIRLRILNTFSSENDLSPLYSILKSVTRYVISKIHHNRYMIPTIIYKYSYLLLSLYIYTDKDKGKDSIGPNNPFRSIFENPYNNCEELYNTTIESNEEICKFFNNPTYINENYSNSIKNKKMAYKLLDYIQVGFFGKETKIQFYIDNYSSRSKLDYVIAKEMAECNPFNEQIVLVLDEKYIEYLLKNDTRKANYPLLARVLYNATLDLSKEEFTIGKHVNCIVGSMDNKVNSHTRFGNITFIDVVGESAILRCDNLTESIPFSINGKKYVIDSSGIR